MEEVEGTKTFKDMLLEYTDYKAKIKFKQLNIKSLEQMEISQSGGGVGDGQPKPTGYVECTMENKAIKKIDNINRLKQEIEILEAKIEAIDSIIDTLNDYSKTIIKLRYIQKYEIWKIAQTKERTENSISKVLQKSINFLEKQYKESNK